MEFCIPGNPDGIDVPQQEGDGVMIVPEEDTFYRLADQTTFERIGTEP